MSWQGTNEDPFLDDYIAESGTTSDWFEYARTEQWIAGDAAWQIVPSLVHLAAEYAGYSYAGRWDMGNKETRPGRRVRERRARHLDRRHDRLVREGHRLDERGGARRRQGRAGAAVGRTAWTPATSSSRTTGRRGRRAPAAVHRGALQRLAADRERVRRRAGEGRPLHRDRRDRDARHLRPRPRVRHRLVRVDVSRERGRRRRDELDGRRRPLRRDRAREHPPRGPVGRTRLRVPHLRRRFRALGALRHRGAHRPRRVQLPRGLEHRRRTSAARPTRTCRQSAARTTSRSSIRTSRSSGARGRTSRCGSATA